MNSKEQEELFLQIADAIFKHEGCSLGDIIEVLGSLLVQFIARVSDDKMRDTVSDAIISTFKDAVKNSRAVFLDKLPKN